MKRSQILRPMKKGMPVCHACKSCKAFGAGAPSEDYPLDSNRMPAFGVLGIDKVLLNILCSPQKGLFMPAVNVKFLQQISDNQLKGLLITGDVVIGSFSMTP